MTRASRVAAGAVGAFAARLALLAGIFALAVLIELRELGPYSEVQLTALYALVLAGFLMALSYAVLAFYGRRGTGSLIFELAGDGGLVTALIYCSGGASSLFGFLYIPWIMYASVEAGGRASLYCTLLAIAAYGAVAFGTAQGWLPAFSEGPGLTLDEAATSFGIHAAAFLSVTLLARRFEYEVQQGQHELMELGELHQRIVDNVASGLLTADRAGTITSFNHAAAEITGIDSIAALGSPLGELFPELPFPLQDEEKARRGELGFEDAAGNRLYLGFSRSLLRDASGLPDGEILIFQDLTRVREMEEQLRRSERLSAVGQLATGLAHEIRNPLASLSGAIELLGADLAASDAASRRLLRIVERETWRLNRLVVDFLAYAGSRSPQCEAVPLAAMLEEIRELLASGNHVDAELDCDVAKELAVWGDPDQLRQVFWNLILNAAQAEPRDRRVRVRARADPPRVRIEVEDRGRGIPPDALERAFEPFFTTKAKGTGLGLSTVHRLVEAHGGELEVTSEAGEGTIVAVVLQAPPGSRGAG